MTSTASADTPVNYTKSVSYDQLVYPYARSEDPPKIPYIFVEVPSGTQILEFKFDSSSPTYGSPDTVFDMYYSGHDIRYQWENTGNGDITFDEPYFILEDDRQEYSPENRYAMKTGINVSENVIVETGTGSNYLNTGSNTEFTIETENTAFGNMFDVSDDMFYPMYGEIGSETIGTTIIGDNSGDNKGCWFYGPSDMWILDENGDYWINDQKIANINPIGNDTQLRINMWGPRDTDDTCANRFFVPAIYGDDRSLLRYHGNIVSEYTSTELIHTMPEATSEDMIYMVPVSEIPEGVDLTTMSVSCKESPWGITLDGDTIQYPTMGEPFQVTTKENQTVEWYLDNTLAETTTGTVHTYLFSPSGNGEMELTARMEIDGEYTSTACTIVYAPNLIKTCQFSETEEWLYINTNQSYGDHITITTTEEDQSIDYPLMSAVDIENQSLSGITPTEDISMTWNTDHLQVSAPESLSTAYNNATRIYQPRLDIDFERPCDYTDIAMKTSTENYDEQYNYYSAGIAIHNGTQAYSQIMAFDCEQYMTGTIKAYDQFAPYSHTVDQSDSLGYVHVVEGNPIKYNIHLNEYMNQVRYQAEGWYDRGGSYRSFDSGLLSSTPYPNDTQLSYQIQSHIYDEPTKVNIFELYTANYDFEHTPTYTQETNYRTMEFGENVYGHMRIPKPDWWDSSENYQMFISPSGAEPPIITEWTPSTENVTIACEETANFQAYSEDFGLWTWYVDGEEVGEHLPSYVYMTLDEVGTHTLEVELKNDVGKHTNQWTINVTEIDPAQFLSDTEYIYDGTPITLEADQHVDWSIRYDGNTLGTDTSTPTTAFDPGQSNQHGLLEFQVEFGNYRGTQTETIDIFIPEEVGYSPSNSIDINPLDTDKIMNGDGHEIFGEITKPYTSSGIPLSALIVSILVVFATAMYGEQKSTVPLIVVFLTLAGSILYSLPIPQYITTPLFAIVAIIAGAILILPFKDR